MSPRILLLLRLAASVLGAADPWVDNDLYYGTVFQVTQDNIICVKLTKTKSSGRGCLQCWSNSHARQTKGLLIMMMVMLASVLPWGSWGQQWWHMLTGSGENLRRGTSDLHPVRRPTSLPDSPVPPACPCLQYRILSTCLPIANPIFSPCTHCNPQQLCRTTCTCGDSGCIPQGRTFACGCGNPNKPCGTSGSCCTNWSCSWC